MENTIEPLPKNFNISKDETVLICLKGTNKEWLICTDKKLYILKRGFMTGHLAGDSNFQMPYKNITGAHTDYHLLTGYFEVSTGGTQNVQKTIGHKDKTAHSNHQIVSQSQENLC